MQTNRCEYFSLIKEFDMHDFMDINQLSKEFLDNFRTNSNDVLEPNSPKVRFNAKLFKKVKRFTKLKATLSSDIIVSSFYLFNHKQ